MQDVKNSEVAWKEDSTCEIYAVSNEKTKAEAQFAARDAYADEHGSKKCGSTVVNENEGTGIYKVLVYDY